MIAPALRLDLAKGREIVLMLLSPPARPHNVSVEKNVLTIPDGEATVTVTTGNGEVRCQGTFPAQAKSLSFDNMPSLLSGTESKGTGNKEDYVIGDGIGVSYTIRLLFQRGLGRHSSDKTRLYVT